MEDYTSARESFVEVGEAPDGPGSLYHQSEAPALAQPLCDPTGCRPDRTFGIFLPLSWRPDKKHVQAPARYETSNTGERGSSAEELTRREDAHDVQPRQGSIP